MNPGLCAVSIFWQNNLVADYGVVDDLFSVAEAFKEKLGDSQC